jgi:hypothetical protein
MKDTLSVNILKTFQDLCRERFRDVLAEFAHFSQATSDGSTRHILEEATRRY